MTTAKKAQSPPLAHKCFCSTIHKSRIATVGFVRLYITFCNVYVYFDGNLPTSSSSLGKMQYSAG